MGQRPTQSGLLCCFCSSPWPFWPSLPGPGLEASPGGTDLTHGQQVSPREEAGRGLLGGPGKPLSGGRELRGTVGAWAPSFFDCWQRTRPVSMRDTCLEEAMAQVSRPAPPRWAVSRHSGRMGRAFSNSANWGGILHVMPAPGPELRELLVSTGLNQQGSEAEPGSRAWTEAAPAESLQQAFGLS